MGLFDFFKGKTKHEDKVDVKKDNYVSLDLAKRVEKSSNEFGLCLEKNKMSNVKARVVLAIDESGSMEFEGLYSRGFVQKVFERLMPVGLKFDDNKSIESYTFNTYFREHAEVNMFNLENYVKDEIGRIEGGGTAYAPIINELVKKHIQNQNSFKDNLPTFVIFITDGENSDWKEAEKAIIRASKENIFFMAIGIGNERFEFLSKLDDLSGREKDNFDFEAISNIDKISDKELYNILMREFKTFVGK